MGQVFHLLQRERSDDGLDVGDGFFLFEEGERVVGGQHYGAWPLVVVEIVGRALEEAAEFLQIAEVEALDAARYELFGDVVREAVGGKKGVGALDAFEACDAADVDGDHGEESGEWRVVSRES